MNAIVPRATIDQIEAHRTRCLALYEQAFDLVDQAQACASAAAPKCVYELPGLHGRNQTFTRGREDFLEGVRRPLDRSIWTYLLQATALDRLMDRKAKEEFRAQLEKDPPPATADNCFATMQQLVGDADLIFKRGIANAFSGLDRRFRSHDGFKVGGRIVLTYFTDSWGHITNRRDVLIDVERTFAVLDGKAPPEPNGGILGALGLAQIEANAPVLERATYEASSEFFRVRVFKNGNAHVWFLRDDLVEKVNLLLADYYGAALGAAPDVADRKHEATRTPAKNYGFFESPPAVVETVLGEAGLSSTATDTYGRAGCPVRTVLEPNAGGGAIALAAAKLGHTVSCVEIQPDLAAQLLGRGFARTVCADFLDQVPEVLGTFDIIVMNPPFDGGRDIDHVTHALRFLKPGGKLVSVMSAGVEFREDRKTTDFRAFVERAGGRFRDLPPGSFAPSGTNVNTCLLSLSLRASA